MKKVDIAVAGSGIACTATLIEVFNKLIKAPVAAKLSIAVFEKGNEFWYGIPYGSRSSVNALTITSVYDFFTDEKERNLFFAWFKQNKASLMGYYLANGGYTAQQWLKRNSDALNNEDYKNVYLPRFMCGKYNQSKFDRLLKIVEDEGLVELQLITAEVIDVNPENGNYVVKYESPDKSILSLTAVKVVIATGSAPAKDVKLPEGNATVAVINNLYEPRVDENIAVLTKGLSNVKNAAERNVLLLGSNASSIEFLYLLAGLPHVLELINKLVVISPSGKFPYPIVKKTLENYPADNLDKLKEAGNYSLETLVAASMQDIKIAVKDGVIVPHIDRVIGYTMELLGSLDENAKRRFIGIHGMQLSNQFRRSGTDYKGGEGLLTEMQKLVMLRGYFKAIESTGNGSVLQYTDPETGEEKTYTEKFKVTINCTGANDLEQSSSRLIYNLVHKGLASVNLSGKGFLVNEKFEAAPNLYVMGPLLGGNKNARIHFWHLENASRIMYLAPFLADCLTEESLQSALPKKFELTKRYQEAG